MALIMPSSSVQADDTALLKFVNSGPNATIRFYVDGRSSCAADAGSYCNDSTTVGTHSFYARYEDPRYQAATACASKSYYVPAGGFTWTC
jgi:hypothetical protein